jgi:hypothetical protein
VCEAWLLPWCALYSLPLSTPSSEHASTAHATRSPVEESLLPPPTWLRRDKPCPPPTLSLRPHPRPHHPAFHTLQPVPGGGDKLPHSVFVENVERGTLRGTSRLFRADPHRFHPKMSELVARLSTRGVPSAPTGASGVSLASGLLFASQLGGPAVPAGAAAPPPWGAPGGTTLAYLPRSSYRRHTLLPGGTWVPRSPSPRS